MRQHTLSFSYSHACQSFLHMDVTDVLDVHGWQLHESWALWEGSGSIPPLSWDIDGRCR